ncbi:MraZ protein [Lutibacter oricola]|uniref:Transcriptional regulator MraZ n=1 Tax=Lutibacter oricola TaxID=762486 RepID=A0A1H3EAJ0_9FLAO|nr:division/cell wall cluster transcriptional repressor MraZ [Lutibacter oricola]SDX75675.1 MraZ protein [Lutibacter oricola]
MINLIGTYECKADAKGRVALSSGFKKQLSSVLQDGFVLKRSVFESCLELYPMSEWALVNKEVSGLNRFVKANNDFIRRFNAGVKIVELDASGRFLIPKDLMAFSGIKKEVVLCSVGGYLEIWDKDMYESSVNNSEVPFSELAEDVMGNKNTDSNVS